MKNTKELIVENEKGEILLQKKRSSKQWELPSDDQELNDEPGLHLAQLTLYRMFSRTDFSSYYAEGDEVFSNKQIYMAKSYFGYLRTRNSGLSTTERKFFSLYDLPQELAESSKLIVDAYAADHFWVGG